VVRTRFLAGKTALTRISKAGYLEDMMVDQFPKLIKIKDVLTLYGQDLVQSMFFLVVGLIAIRLIIKLFKRTLSKITPNVPLVSAISNTIYVILLVTVITTALVPIGLDTRNVLRFLIIISLVTVALIIIFRPYIPSLPFKVGNTIKTGELLGKVESTTFLNTRMRTFDGKTVWIPNSKILNDYMINYHLTPSRRVNLDVRIRYDQDLMKAKQVLEAIMIEDPRTLAKPRPIVYVTHLLEDCVTIGGRCWVDNLKYWRVRCDLLEKTKLRFDNEGIAFAYPQRDVHVYNKTKLVEDAPIKASCAVPKDDDFEDMQ